MTPTSWFTFFSLIFLLLPGMYSDYLARRYKQSQTETRLQELARIILGSVAFSLLSITSIVLINQIKLLRFIDVVDFSIHPAGYYGLHPQSVFSFFLLEIVLSLGYVWLFNAFRVAFSRPNFTSTNQWEILFRNRPVKAMVAPTWIDYVANRIRKPIGKIFKSIPQQLDDSFMMPVALVELTNGSAVVGYVDVFSTEEGLEGRELILSPVQDQFKPNLPHDFQKVFVTQSKWSRFYVPMSSILSVEVVYFQFPAN